MVTLGQLHEKSPGKHQACSAQVGGAFRSILLSALPTSISISEENSGELLRKPTWHGYRKEDDPVGTLLKKTHGKQQAFPDQIGDCFHPILMSFLPKSTSSVVVYGCALWRNLSRTWPRT